MQRVGVPDRSMTARPRSSTTQGTQDPVRDLHVGGGIWQHSGHTLYGPQTPGTKTPSRLCATPFILVDW